MFWYFILIVFCFCCAMITYYAIKFFNPYKLLMVFGKKGSGKTTLLTKLAYKHSKKGWNVYSTEPVPGAYLIAPEDIGHVYIPPKSVIFVDEVGLIWHNRSYKDFDKSLIEYFKLQRHYGHKIYLFSQAWDIDKVLRLLCDALYITDTYFCCISVARRIKRKLVVVAPTGETESRIADQLLLEPFFLFWLGSAIITWIPRWSKHFDSFAASPDWEKKEFDYKPLPENQWANRFVKMNGIKIASNRNRSRKKKRRKRVAA